MGKGNRLREERNHTYSESFVRGYHQYMREYYAELGKIEKECRAGAVGLWAWCATDSNGDPDCVITSYSPDKTDETLSMVINGAMDKYTEEAHLVIVSSGNPQEWAELRGLFKQNCQFVIGHVTRHLLARPQGYVYFLDMRDLLDDIKDRMQLSKLFSAA